jgi:cobaltochelatase CobN
MTKKRKQITLILVIAIVLGSVWVVWKQVASTTQIALVNFQAFQTTSIVRANTDDFIRYKEVPVEAVRNLDKYDFVLAFGMGLQISVEQRATLQDIADKGTPVYVFSATSPENNICNLDSVDKVRIQDYLSNGNKRNYRELAKYIRQNIDKKKFFVQAADTAVKSASDVLYHLDETVAFEQVADYETYLKEHHFFRANAPKIAIVGGLNDPFSGNKDNVDSLIVSLQRSGCNVYPVASFMKRLDFLKEIQPDAVIYFAHGRLVMGQADAAVAWLKERNIPIFAPLAILQTKEEWQADPMGMFGGFMSQSIVMPELDGAIYPYVIDAQEIDKEGLYVFKAIPERLQTFTQILSNFMSLRQKSNAEKKIAIYYFKGAGQSTLTAQGLETVPALYNFLKRLKVEGYKVDGLPADVPDFEKMLMKQGAVLSTYAEGAFDDFLRTGNPDLIEKTEYETWANQALTKESYADVVAAYGPAPGNYMRVDKEDKSYLAVARIQLGNIVLLPQPMAGLGSDAFAIVHGAKAAPPHTYIASYLWSQYAFKADALLHFGTHGSLEFTLQKQVALSHNDWPDRLVGALPHFYYYTIGNIGESMMAKRRSYATTISYLTPAFMNTEMRSQFKTLQDKIRNYYKTEEALQPKASLDVKKTAVEMGLHRDLRLDSLPTNPYTTEEIERIENFAEEIANEKMTGHLYTSGIPYSDEKIRSTVLAMSADPIAYSVANLDRLNGRISEKQLKSKSFFTQTYLAPAQSLVNRILNGAEVNEALILATAHIKPEELTEAKTILAPVRRMMSDMPKKPEYTSEQKARARAITEIERTIDKVLTYKNALKESPEQEFQSLLNALNGGYIVPSSGGDAVANPNAVPTGRNLYAINAEATPSEVAWEKGVSLVNATLEQYKKQHDTYPRKVSYTFWSSEFIESEGTTIAQVLYMLGVEPVRDSYGRVSDLQLIPSERLGRPRIDVVVQTSGQFRDLAASRLALISRAVEMAASAENDASGNYVAGSAVETERLLVEQGVSPKEAREMSLQRIFGGINGMYGTGIQGMVTAGDKWESEKEIADTYIHNMGAVYGNDKNWGQYHEGLLRAALHNTDVVIQPRQSNTWGALSLDHVYEFMGGMNLAVREVTGKDPEAYFADYRNRNNVKIQELKEAIGVEARSTVFNPAYIKEVMKGNASSAAQITEVVTNTYAWNVMKPNVIDNEMWNKLYEVYVKDAYALGTEAFFRRENPQALQEITAVMLETVRKGMWQASEQQLSEIAQLHTDLVKEFGSSASGFAGGNVKLQDFIAQKINPQSVGEYRQQMQEMKTKSSTNEKGMVLKKDATEPAEAGEKTALNGIFIVSAVLVAFVLLLIVLRRKRKQ